MRNSLDFDNNIFKSLLDKSTDLIIKEYGALDNQIGYHDISQKEVESWFNEKVPNSFGHQKFTPHKFWQQIAGISYVG